MTRWGNLEQIDNLRSIWKDETYDFSTWISEGENLALLSKEIGIDINNNVKEKRIND